LRACISEWQVKLRVERRGFKLPIGRLFIQPRVALTDGKIVRLDDRRPHLGTFAGQCISDGISVTPGALKRPGLYDVALRPTSTNVHHAARMSSRRRENISDDQPL
jgi:hypothetical protein